MEHLRHPRGDLPFGRQVLGRIQHQEDVAQSAAGRQHAKPRQPRRRRMRNVVGHAPIDHGRAGPRCHAPPGHRGQPLGSLTATRSGQEHQQVAELIRCPQSLLVAHPRARALDQLHQRAERPRPPPESIHPLGEQQPRLQDPEHLGRACQRRLQQVLVQLAATAGRQQHVHPVLAIAPLQVPVGELAPLRRRGRHGRRLLQHPLEHALLGQHGRHMQAGVRIEHRGRLQQVLGSRLIGDLPALAGAAAHEQDRRAGLEHRQTPGRPPEVRKIKRHDHQLLHRQPCWVHMHR